VSENQSPWVITWHCLHDSEFSRFDIVAAYEYDGQMET